MQGLKHFWSSKDCDPEAAPSPTWLQRTLITTFSRTAPGGENETQVIKKPDLTGECTDLLSMDLLITKVQTADWSELVSYELLLAVVLLSWT